jgi:hypothetical protein
MVPNVPLYNRNSTPHARHCETLRTATKWRFNPLAA